MLFPIPGYCSALAGIFLHISQISFGKFALLRFPNRSRGGKGKTPRLLRTAKGGENVKPNSLEEHKEHTFDSFCKKILKHEARDYYKNMQYRREHEISLSELSEEALEPVRRVGTNILKIHTFLKSWALKYP